jgi:hypothetical protein
MDECIPKFRNFRYAGGHNKVGVLQSLGATIQAVFILRGWRSIGCSAEVGRQNACSVRHVARGRGSETNSTTSNQDAASHAVREGLEWIGSVKIITG